MKHAPSLATLALLAGCAATAAPTEADRSLEVSVLLDADRAFAADTADRGLDGWLAWFTEDAVKLANVGEPHLGREAIAVADGPLFADVALRLRWEPDLGGWLVPGERGYTRGTWRIVNIADGDVAVASGTYLTLWRLTADGWRCELDFGVSDS